MDPGHQPGDLVADRYRIVGLLGRGGVGTTYDAESLADGSRVALKQLWLWNQHDWKVLELFQREVRVLASLSHPLIPRYLGSFQVETDRGPCFYLARELAPGRSLAQWIAAGWQPSELEVHAVADALLGVLEHLHRLVPPVIHRDIKPDNVIRSEDGQVRLVDFGAVRDTFRTLAHGSTVVGTFGYMAPEQLHGQAIPATDLYGLGTTLVFLLTRTAPSSLAQKRGRPAWRGSARVSRPFAKFIDKLLAPIPEDRYQSALQARLALRRVEQARRPSVARVALVAALGVLAIIPVVVALAWPVKHASGIADATRTPLPHKKVDQRVPMGRLRFVRAFRGHVGPVMNVAWLPDGKHLVSSGMGGSVRVWDAKTGKQVQVLVGHSDRVDGLAVTPDGHNLVTGSKDKTVRIWDLSTGTELRKLDDHHAQVTSVAISKDGKLIASSDVAGKVTINDFKTGRVLSTLSAPPKVICVRFGRGAELATGGDDGPVRLWDASTGKLEATLPAHTGPVDKIAFTPDGQTLISAGDDHTLRIWAVGARHLVRTIDDHDNEVWGLSLSPDGKEVASSDKDGVLVVEDVLTTVLRARSEHADERGIPSVAFSPDGKLLAVAGASTVLRLWGIAAPSWRPPWVKAPVPRVKKKPPRGLSKAELLCFEAESQFGARMSRAKIQALLDAALAEDPKCARALVDMGRLEYKLGHLVGWDYRPDSLVRAHKFIDQALAMAPDMYEAHLYKAYAYMFQKKLDDASKEAALAEKAKADDPRTQFFYISLAERHGDAGGILLHARSLIESSSDPEVLSRAYEGLETAYAQRGEWDAVEHCYTSEINLDPDSAWAKGDYAAFLVRRERFDEAIAEATRAIAQMNYPMAHITRADAYAGKALQILRKGGKRDDAKRLIDKALAESRYSPGAYYSLGVYEQTDGDQSAAESDFKKALAVDRNYEPARRALGSKAPPRPRK